MTIGYDIREYLTEGGYTATVNDVNGALQDTIAVMETGGLEPVRSHGLHGTTRIIDRPSFQIIVRNKSKPAASSTVEGITALLDGVICTNIAGNYYLQITQSSPPIFLGRVQTEKGETNEYSLNFTAQVQRTQTS